MNSTFGWRTPLAMLTSVLLTTTAFAQPVVDWVTVTGTARRDAARGDLVVSSKGDLVVPGVFDWQETWLLSGTVLFKCDRTGKQIESMASRGEVLESAAVDSEGNHLVTGRVWRPADLGMGVKQQFYIAKYSASGARLWERTAGASWFSQSYVSVGFKIIVDSVGNAYVAGASHGPGTFGGVTFPNTAGGPLLCKYDPNGKLLWAKRAEGQWVTILGLDTKAGGGNAYHAILDSEGNVVITGHMFNGPANFDGITITIEGPNPGGDQFGSFIAKYSAAGHILWAKAIPNSLTTTINRPDNVAVDRHGNVLVNGALIDGHAQLGQVSKPLEDPSGYHSFVAKFDPAGAVLWVKAAPARGLATDSEDNVYSGTAKLDRDGNVLWARTVPGATLKLATLNKRAEPVFTGAITGTVHFDDHTVEADPSSLNDSVICKAGSDGTFQWALGLFGGGVSDMMLVPDKEGALYVSGGVGVCRWFAEVGGSLCYDTSSLGPFPLTIEAGGSNDIFFARISDPVPPFVELKAIRTSAGLTLSWPAAVTGFALESADALPASAWMPVTRAPVVEAGQNVVTVETGVGATLFRLRKP